MYVKPHNQGHLPAIALLWALLTVHAVHAAETGKQGYTYERGGIIRGCTASREMSLVFTGDEFGEATKTILDVLKSRDLKASFFVTGNFLRKNGHGAYLQRIVEEGHYLGPHSDAHLLYCSWENRDRSLVSRESFAKDLQRNIHDIRELNGLTGDEKVLFIPPFEWFNEDQVRWCREIGVTLFNFTPGSGSNRDWAPESHPSFVSSREIYDGILDWETRDPHGLNGFLLLLHLGSGRQDPMHALFAVLLDEIVRRGYRPVHVDHLLRHAQ